MRLLLLVPQVLGRSLEHLWKRPNRSFSGAWSGVHSSGRSAGTFNLTRQAAVENILATERAMQRDANDNGPS